MARGDDLSTEFEVTGDGERALERIRQKLQDIGTTAEYASRKQVDGSKGPLAAYKQEADVLEALAASTARLASQQARTRVASNRVAASNATTAATVSTAAPTAEARQNLAIYREIEAEQRAINIAQEQQNRNLLTAGKLLTEQERQQNLIQQRTIAAAREEERARAAVARTEQQAAAAAIKAEQQRAQLVNNRIGRERTAALQAERNAAALASPGLGSERRTSLANDAAISSRDVEQSNALRYALYDTAQTATIVGTAISGIGAASLVAGAQAEQQFANLSATIGDTEYPLGNLNQSLIDITKTSPIDLGEVVGVAQLGAQMNVAEGDLDEFTKTITQFSATTNVTSDQAAESFGRISQLLDVPADKFQNLSSAIYQVGVDSVATESQILKTSEEIAGSAQAYGFTAQQVVGLSGAFASLAIQPEQARGATTRIFNQIETAVQEGGPKLDNYARILGTTREQAENLWRSDPSAFFEKLVHGLAESQDRLADIRSIGATGVYDTNVLQRLASNADFLSKSLETSRTAYDEGTAASDAYAKATDTTIAKLKELQNSLVALGARAGGGLLVALEPAIELIKLLVDGFSSLPAPVLAFLAALTLIVGGFILFKGAQAAAIAGVIGLRYVLTQLGETAIGTGLSMATLRTQIGLLRAQTTVASAGTTKLTGTIAAAGVSARVANSGIFTLANGMRLLNWGAGIALGLQFSYMLIENALRARQAADGLRKVQDAQGEVSTDTLVSSFKTANATVREFADQFNGRSGGLDQINAKVNSFFNQFIDATPGLNNAKREIGAIDDQLASMVSSGNGDRAAATVEELGLSADQIKTLLPGYSAALDTAGQATANMGDEADSASSQLDAYKQSVDDAKAGVEGLFASLNQSSDFAGSIQQLFSGIYDAGNAFGYLNETGRTNLANLQDAMAQTIAYGQTVGLGATDSISLLFYQLQQSGVDTASLLRLIASQPYMFSADLDISKVQSKLAAIGRGGLTSAVSGGKQAQLAFGDLNKTMGKLAVSAPRAATGTKKAGRAAKEAAKEVKTLNDYASDLQTVFSDATQYRFGVQDALDDIDSKWKTIRDDISENNEKLKEHKQDIADAQQKLRESRADLWGLQADLSQKRYFLSVAVQYGDTLRAGEIRGDIADLNAQIAAKQKDINDAQKDARAPFEGTTKSIIDQRESLGDLYDAYQKAIVEYARSGASQEDVARKTNELRQQFVDQATQAGYSKTEIDRYSTAFDDLTYSILHVPRKITVAANTNPAIQALNDFLAKAASSKATPTVDDDSGTTYQNGVDAGYNFGQAVADGAARRLTSADVTQQLTQAFNTTLNNLPAKSTIGGLTFADGGFIPGKNAFPVGGYVPGARPADRRFDNGLGLVKGGGVVSLQGGEPIMTNAARSKYGDAMFDQINALRFQPNVIRPNITVAGGGAGGGIVELGPVERGLLAEIAQRVGITITPTALQDAVNAGNGSSNRRMQG